MKKQFITKIKKMLESQREEILEKVSRDAALDIDIDGDETDEIQGKILAHTNAQLAARDKDRILKIDNALKKIVEGTFGVCEECGDDIAEQRLMVNPGFITCIGCAEHLEMISKRNGR